MIPEPNRTYCVYKHTLPDGRYYIGATYRGAKRWGKDGCHYKSSKTFFPLIQLIGWENIKHEILFSNLSSKEAREKEQELIEAAQKVGLSLNIVNGGYNIISKEQMHEIVGLRRLKLSYPEIAKRYSVHPDTVARICKKKSYLSYFSPEDFEVSVANFISANKDKYQRRSKLPLTNNNFLPKRVVKKDKNGKIVGRFISISAAARESGVLATSIHNNLKGLSKLCGGYKYEYE